MTCARDTSNATMPSRGCDHGHLFFFAGAPLSPSDDDTMATVGRHQSHPQAHARSHTHRRPAHHQRQVARSQHTGRLACWLAWPCALRHHHHHSLLLVLNLVLDANPIPPDKPPAHKTARIVYVSVALVPRRRPGSSGVIFSQRAFAAPAESTSEPSRDGDCRHPVTHYPRRHGVVGCRQSASCNARQAQGHTPKPSFGSGWPAILSGHGQPPRNESKMGTA